MNGSHTVCNSENAVRSKIEAFIDNHTEFYLQVPLVEECPICLETYTAEPCVYIKGIQGCRHRVGLTCLRTWLQSHPNQDKKCPLCRTVWIKAPARSVASTVRGALNSYMTADMEARIQELISRQPYNPYTDGRNRPVRAPIFESDADDVDYETQRERYEEYSRDIERIRSRAGTKRFQGNRLRQDANATLNTATLSANSLAANGLAGQSSSSRQPVRAASSAQGSKRSDHHHRHSSLEVNPSTVQSWFSDSASSSTSRPADAGTSGAGAGAGAGVVEARQVQGQSDVHDSRIRQLEQRQTRIENRERHLNERATLLTQRDINLRVQEQRRSDIRAMIAVQQAELQDLLHRHSQALERALR